MLATNIIIRLKSLEIKNFRKVNELEVEFPPGLSVIVGENNVGKTTIIDVMSGLNL